MASINSAVFKVCSNLYKHCFISLLTITRICWKVQFLRRHFGSFTTKSSDKFIHFWFGISSEFSSPCFCVVYAFIRLHVPQLVVYCLQFFSHIKPKIPIFAYFETWFYSQNVPAQENYAVITAGIAVNSYCLVRKFCLVRTICCF